MQELSTMTRVRTTLTIDQDVIERYQSIALVQGESLSAAVSNWLKFTVESAELVASELHRVKASLNPQKAATEVAETLRVIRERYENVVFTVNGEDRSPARPDALASGRGGGRSPIPPSSNTGGKGPKPRAGSTPSNRRSPAG
jgi:hypothetical protein